MKIKYECNVCGQQFDSPTECEAHEHTHSELDYNLVTKAALLLKIKQEDICDYCDNSYYVYGCEQDCEYDDCGFKNNYKDFIPTEPFHNKRTYG